jgi:ribonuclease-3
LRVKIFERIFKRLYFFDKRDFKFRLKMIMGLRPGNLSLYEAAFIHRSASYLLPDGTRINNERLEYLGDAVIDAILSEHLFEKYSNASEGALTKIRARIVNREELNRIALSMGFDKLLVNNVCTDSCIRNLYGDAFEAFMGAIFIDKGYKKTKKVFIKRILNKYLNLEEIVHTDTDFKSLIYEWGQKHKTNLVFECDEEYDHTQKQPVFSSIIYLDREEYGKGMGMSKKEAEQEASKQAWMKVNELSMAN